MSTVYRKELKQLFTGMIGWIFIAFVLLFAQLWGVTGVWMAFPATEILTFVLALAIYGFTGHSVIL